MLTVTHRTIGELVAPKTVTAQSLERVGARAVIMIARRTAKGLDYKGEKFRPYEVRYAKFRKEAGRQVDRVDLNFSGRMMGSLMYKVNASAGSVTLFFPPSEAAKAHGNQEAMGRRFFDFSQAELDALGKTLAGRRRG